MKTASLRLVFDRKNLASKKREASVLLEVSFERLRRYYPTGVRLYSDQWSKKDSKVKNHAMTVEYNKKLHDLTTLVFNFISDLELKQIPFTFEKLNQHICGCSCDKADNSFLIFMSKRIEERSVAENTKIRQRCVLKALQQWGVIRSFQDLTTANIQKYDDFAKSRCNKQSSVYNYHKILKTFVGEAFAAQKITFNPYVGRKLKKGETSIRKYLRKEELDLIAIKDIENESLSRVRDLFLFCCYTGLAYSDLASFDFSKAVFSDGMYRLVDTRNKTGEEYNISLMDKAMVILYKYGFNLPIISNQKYNSYLKLLGAYCGIKKNLTSHVARHTFATTIALNNGIRIEAVSRMLGHSNIRTTQIYAKINQEEVDKAFNKLNRVI